MSVGDDAPGALAQRASSHSQHLQRLLSATGDGSGVSSPSFSITFASLQQPQATLRQRCLGELARLSKLAGPLFVQNVLSYSSTVVAVAFVGHLNDPQLLSSAVLANSLYNVTGYSLLSGLASGMESLCGQVCARASALAHTVLPRASRACNSLRPPPTLLLSCRRLTARAASRRLAWCCSARCSSRG
jgi:hypothetical protein